MNIGLNDGEIVSREELNKHIDEFYNKFNNLDANDVETVSKTSEQVRRFNTCCSFCECP